MPTVTAAPASASSAQLWIARINAASRVRIGVTYSKFMAGLKKAVRSILDRKMLADTRRQ